jgi:hypothetical protein
MLFSGKDEAPRRRLLPKRLRIRWIKRREDREQMNKMAGGDNRDSTRDAR